MATDYATLEEEKVTFIGQGQPGVHLLLGLLSLRIVKNGFGGK